jgi:lipooligosaccharide transport system ATP-binding protein
MKMIYCFSPRTSGTLSVLGLDPDRDPAAIKNRLGVVPQTDNLDDEVTVAQNLEIYAGYFGLSRRVVREKIRSLLEFMALGSRANARIRELSGGMKRRLVIARALLNDPELLILDEPTTGLDPQVRHLIWAKLRELKERGTTLLLTTHYMEEAHELCDRLLVMDRGKVLDSGKPKELVNKAIPPYVLEVPAAWGKAVGAFPPQVQVETHGDKLFLYSASPDLLEKVAVEMHGDFRIRTTDLEDLFLKLTGRDLGEAE